MLTDDKKDGTIQVIPFNLTHTVCFLTKGPMLRENYLYDKFSSIHNPRIWLLI